MIQKRTQYLTIDHIKPIINKLATFKAENENVVMIETRQLTSPKPKLLPFLIGYFLCEKKSKNLFERMIALVWF